MPDPAGVLFRLPLSGPVLSEGTVPEPVPESLDADTGVGEIRDGAAARGRGISRRKSPVRMRPDRMGPLSELRRAVTKPHVQYEAACVRCGYDSTIVTDSAVEREYAAVVCSKNWARYLSYS